MNDRIKGVVAGTAAGLAGVAGAAAQSRLQDKFFPGPSTPDDVASAGNGGVATSSASGGAIGVGDVNSGGNAGNAVGIGDTSGGAVSARRWQHDEHHRPRSHRPMVARPSRTPPAATTTSRSSARAQ